MFKFLIMKKYLLFNFIIFCSVVNAQNWSIINSTEKFNFRLDGDNIISTTIWVDSIHLNGNDSIYFMNRIVCDSCIVIVNGPMGGCDSCYGSINAPTFLQRTIHFNDSVYNLVDTGNIIIHPFANLNDGWLFDSVWNVNAQVIDLKVDSVFSSTDSVKVILLSTGDTVVISKNNGILVFPFFFGSGLYYRLVGIEGRDVGELVPKFQDFFNFDIGDRFEYHTDGGYPGCHYWEIKQSTVTSKNIIGDTIRYDISVILERKETITGWGGSCAAGYWYGTYNEVLEFIDSTNHITNKFNFQPHHILTELWNMLPCTANDSAYDGVRMSLDSNNVISKSFGFSTSISSFDYVFYSQINYNSDTLLISTWPHHASYKVGLGQTEHVVTMCFEGGEYGYLSAYTKGNTTVGVFTDSTSILLNAKEFEKNYSVLYPNPVNDKLFIHQSGSDRSQIKVYNSLGELVKEKFIESISDYLPVDDLQGGIYFVKIISKSRSDTRRILIQH